MKPAGSKNLDKVLLSKTATSKLAQPSHNPPLFHAPLPTCTRTGLSLAGTLLHKACSTNLQLTMNRNTSFNIASKDPSGSSTKSWSDLLPSLATRPQPHVAKPPNHPAVRTVQLHVDPNETLLFDSRSARWAAHNAPTLSKRDQEPC